MSRPRPVLPHPLPNLRPLLRPRSVARSELFKPTPSGRERALVVWRRDLEDLQETGELFSAVLQGVGDLVLTDFLLSTQASDIGDDFRYLFFDRVELATGINARGEYSPEPPSTRDQGKLILQVY